MITPLTVRQVIDWFVASNGHLTANQAALKERKRIWAMFSDRYGDRLVSDMIGADLVEFVQAQPHLKAINTVDRWYRSIKRPFAEAERLGLIPKQPFRGVRSRKGNEGRDLTPTEFRFLLRHSTAAFRRAATFLRFSGARPDEMRAIQWHHVFLDARVIVLRQHKTDRTGRPRRIYLCPVLVKLLRWIRRHSTGSYVFLNSRGRPWQTSALCKTVREIRAACGLPSDVRLYGCRHFFATSAIVHGVDIATLAELMGHVGTTSTSRYTHLVTQSDYLSRAAERAVRSL